MRLLICAGGTGGGVYPALAVLQSLKENIDPGQAAGDVLWVGVKGGMEKDIVQRAEVRYQSVHAAGLHGVGLRSLPGNIVSLVRGTFEARDVLREFKPDVMLFTGGFVAGPVALAGWTLPSVLYVPDIEPGLALKALGRKADAIAVTAPQSREFFPDGKEVHVTGYPVRPALKRWERQMAFQTLELSPNDPVLLVFGGSKGARSINRALMGCLPELLEETQVAHITGTLDWPEVKSAREGLSSAQRNRYRAYAYLHERMGAAFTTADLVLSRAGASALGEFPSFGLPAILVPYPHAWRYQRVNAQYLADRGAAVIVNDEELSQKLLPQVQALLGDDQRRREMKENMLALARPKAAENIGRLLSKVGRGGGDVQ